MRFNNIMIAVFCCLLAACSSNLTIHDSNVSWEDVERHNQAAKVVLTTSFFIGHTARNCKNLLEEKNAFMKNILESWDQNNAKHVDAANHWTIDYALDVSNRNGQNKGIRYVGEIMSDVNESGDIASDNLLSMSVNENKNICRKFKSEIESGKYDLSNSTLYPQIVKLAALINNS